MPKAGFIAIVGRPNAGKSTLINRVLNRKLSIVTPKAQTTRDRVLGILTENGRQIVFVDTPGIHRAKEGGLNAYMVSEAAGAMEDTVAIWYIVDPNSALMHEEAVLALLERTNAPVFLLLNKSDLRHAAANALSETLGGAMKDRRIRFEAPRFISAQTGEGVDRLLAESWDLLPESPFYYEDEDQMSDRPVRFFVAEKIREQLYLCLGEELPYACAVEIQKFDERAKPPRIEAVIHVERDSQKGMVIGKAGQKIKEIGQAARKEAEEFLGHPIFLGLQVKVLKDWSKDRVALSRLGYNLPKDPAKDRARRGARK